jgi:hypothetical protein
MREWMGGYRPRIDPRIGPRMRPRMCEWVGGYRPRIGPRMRPRMRPRMCEWVGGYRPRMRPRMCEWVGGPLDSRVLSAGRNSNEYTGRRNSTNGAANTRMSGWIFEQTGTPGRWHCTQSMVVDEHGHECIRAGGFSTNGWFGAEHGCSCDGSALARHHG